MLIFKKYYFDASHYMPTFEKGHHYRNMHGHSYEVIIKLSGKVNTKNNWVMDFDEIDSYVKPVISILDHSVLNDIDGLKHPTSENIAKWLWKRIKKKIPNLESIEINRPRIGGCVFNGD